jgi:hypothetical protein
MNGENCLRAARIARGLSLEKITAQTRLSPHITEKIDQGRFDELPPGLYARAYVRAFAQVVGLDPQLVLAELGPVLPDAPDPLPRIREAKRDEPWIELPPRGKRYAASAIDGLFIAIVVAVGASAIQASSGVEFTAPGVIPALGLAVITIIVTAPYFLLMAGVAGRTFGQYIAGVPVVETVGPMTLGDVARRAGEVCLAESSIVLDLLGTLTPPLSTTINPATGSPVTDA